MRKAISVVLYRPIVYTLDNLYERNVIEEWSNGLLLVSPIYAGGRGRGVFLTHSAELYQLSL